MHHLAAVGLVLLALGDPVRAAAAPPQTSGAPEGPRVDVWGAVSGVVTGPAGTLVSSYSPPLLFDGDFTSRGGQALAADTAFAFGLTAGVSVFRRGPVGVQILFDRASSAVSGMNSAYTVALQYVSLQPPNNDAQTVNVNQTSRWPDTSGSLTEMAFAFNAVVRIGRPDRLSATISGGPAYFRLSGQVQPVGFTTFQLGGHSVLFEDQYRLAVAVEPGQAFGFDGGGDLAAPLGQHVSIIVGYRYFGGPQAEVAATPASVLNSTELTFAQPIADIRSRLALAPIRVSVSGSRALVGVRVSAW